MVSKNQIKLIISLRQKKFRVEHQMFIAEGFKVISEFIEAGFELLHLYASDANLFDNNELHPILISEQELKKISALVTPNNCLAVFKIQKAKLFSDSGLILALDNIRDPGNLGTIIRTSAAAGAVAVLLTEGTVDLYNPKVVRSTMGSLFQLPIVNDLDDEEAVKWLSHNSINIIVADLDSEEYYYSVNLKEPFALVIGNENKGPNDIWRKAAYKQIKIPILRSTESLNASVAAGIILYDAVRQRSYK